MNPITVETAAALYSSVFYESPPDAPDLLFPRLKEMLKNRHPSRSDLTIRKQAAWHMQNCRPHIWLDAPDNSDSLANWIRRGAESPENSAWIAIILDGAFEFAASRFLECSADSAAEIVGRKDSEFYTDAYSIAMLFDGEVCEQDSKPRPGAPPADRRLFQDALIARFDGEKAVFNTVRTALKVRSHFVELNEERRYDWTMRSHPIVSVGLTAETMLQLAAIVGRNRIGFTNDLWSKLPREQQALLFACDIVIGSKTSDALPSARTLQDFSPLRQQANPKVKVRR